MQDNDQPLKSMYHVYISRDPAEVRKDFEKKEGFSLDDYYIMIHSPDGQLKSNSFIITFVDEKGVMNFSAKDTRTYPEAVELCTNALIHTLNMLRSILNTNFDKKDDEDTLRTIEEMLRKEGET